MPHEVDIVVPRTENTGLPPSSFKSASFQPPAVENKQKSRKASAEDNELREKLKLGANFEQSERQEKELHLLNEGNFF